MATVDSAASATTSASMRREGGFPGLLVSFMIASYKSGVAKGGRSLGVSYGGVATRALEALRLAVHHISVDGGGDVLVAVPAGVLGDLMIEFSDLDGIGIPAGGEVEGMPEAVIRFDRVLSEDVVGRVAVIAGGCDAMARLQPGVVLRSHHVAIGAGCRIVGEVGVALRVDKGIATQPDPNTTPRSRVFRTGDFICFSLPSATISRRRVAQKRNYTPGGVSDVTSVTENTPGLRPTVAKLASERLFLACSA